MAHVVSEKYTLGPIFVRGLPGRPSEPVLRLVRCLCASLWLAPAWFKCCRLELLNDANRGLSGQGVWWFAGGRGRAGAIPIVGV